ncbi:MAG TPA: RNA 3'-terminal phosphate cyclase [Myxococcaceae bacterium]|nr:RNA 3'-terminal phosphate cyclase [Myxococcaceae bacterium]
MGRVDPNDGWVEVDGSQGEGGGQVLRTSLSLSLVTGRKFRIRKIRARRDPPGLRPQHLACVRGAEALGGSARGAEVGASELTFEPKPVKRGEYLLEVGSAGSTPLLFQCLFFPLALAGGGQLTLRGGTHVSHSPTYHYLAWIWLNAMRPFGLSADLRLRHSGFYPEGGGEFRATILGAAPEPPNLVELPARGNLRDAEVMSFVGGLPFELAERQARAAVHALREQGVSANAENFPLPVTRSAGTTVFVRAEFEHTLAGFSALGERGRPAEDVGREAAAALASFLESPGSIDEHLSDQILLPAALLAAQRLGPSKPGITRYTPAAVTDHLTTNAAVVERFLPVKVEIGPQPSVTVRPEG